MKKYYLGLDNGGTSCKAVLFDEDGKCISKSKRMLKLITPAPLQTERDMDELWQKNVECIREAIIKAAVNPKEIRGLAVCGHGKGLYLWGKDEKPVRNGIVSTDGRAYEYVNKWNKDGTQEKVFKRNFQSILACQPVSILSWLKDNEKQNYSKIKWIFEVKDYIRFKLTGNAFSEISDYSGANLLDVTERKYSQELLSLFNIEEMINCLPPLCKSTDICGYIDDSVSDLTGLPKGIPVAGGMFDIDACSIAMNVVNNENLCVIAGTWSINEYISKTPVLDHTVLMNSIYCIDDFFLIEESSPTSAGNLEWYVQMFMGKEKAEAEKRGMNIYQYCDELVESISPKDQDIIFLPYIFGSRDNPKAKACFIGLDSHHSQAHIVRAVFEGIVFCHMIHIEHLLTKKKNFKSVRLAGGAANSKVWTQMFADVLDFPVELVQEDELGALGCAIVSAVACGDQCNIQSGASRMTKIGKTYYPGPNKEIYKKKYLKFKKISKSLDIFWK